MNHFFNTLIWQGNSRAMLDAIVDGTPFLFRSVILNAITTWIQSQNLTMIDEKTVFRAVDELAPKEMAEARILPVLEKLRTK
ncbi:MAG: hypothetical protein FWE06_05200 [Oscillospiraceae bacterium]|nr:hypothetical protein [Oscillospiraceae bacterium]